MSFGNTTYINNNEKILEASKLIPVDAAKIDMNEFVDKLDTLIKTGYIFKEGSDYQRGALGSLLECAADTILWSLDNPFPIECSSEKSAVHWGDLKTFGADNIKFTPLGNLLGMQMTESKVPYLGIMCGSYAAGEIPFFAVIYYDSKAGSFRGYVPMSGNTINLDFKSSFGYEVNSKRYDEVVDRYIAKGLLDKDFDRDHPRAYLEITKAYVAKTFKDSKPPKEYGNWDAIKKELEVVFR